MTAFGRARKTINGKDISVEIKSVNNRFFDCSAKLPRAFSYLEEKIKPQMKEILTQYGNLAVLWCDTPFVITPEQSQELYDMIKLYQPNCLVNSRLGNGVFDFESSGDNVLFSVSFNASCSGKHFFRKSVKFTEFSGTFAEKRTDFF